MTEARDFGSAIDEIDFKLYYANAEQFKEQRVDQSLETSFEDYHKKWLPELPKRRISRRSKTLSIEALADFASAEEIDRGFEFHADWIRSGYSILVKELKLCRKKFKRSDDFRFDEFYDWTCSLERLLPDSSEAQVYSVKRPRAFGWRNIRPRIHGNA
jgi:hypothetical protein